MTKVQKRVSEISLIVLLVLAGCSRDRPVSLAEVDGRKITAADFKERYQKYLTASSERDNIVVRKKILNNMVNELLIFEDVRRQGFDADKAFQEKMQDISDQALLDGYAKRVSVDTLTVSEPELWKEFRAYNSKVSARYVYARTEGEAWKLKERLEKGATFKVVAKEVFQDPDLANNGGNLGFFGWGEMEPALQEAAFSLPVGTLSEPVKLKIGYAILKVENRVEVPLASEIDYAQKKPQLEQFIRQRKTVRFVKDVGNQIGRELAPRFNEEAVDMLLKNWQSVMGDVSSSSVVEPARSLSEDQSSTHLVSFLGYSWTIGDFLQKAEKTTAKQRKRVKTANDFKDIATGLAIRSVLLEKARNEGLENDKRVQQQIRTVREDYLLRRWANSVEATVAQNGWDENGLRELYKKNKQEYSFPPLVNVGEILLRTESEATTIKNQIDKGASFDQLARRHSIRTWAAERGGELGFATREAFGKVGDKVFKAKVGQVLGPEFLDPHFVVLKVLAKKESRPKSFEEAREDIIQTLLPQQKQQAFSNAVNNLRARSMVTMDIVALGDVAVAPNQ